MKEISEGKYFATKDFFIMHDCKCFSKLAENSCKMDKVHGIEYVKTGEKYLIPKEILIDSDSIMFNKLKLDGIDKSGFFLIEIILGEAGNSLALYKIKGLESHRNFYMRAYMKRYLMPYNKLNAALYG